MKQKMSDMNWAELLHLEGSVTFFVTNVTQVTKISHVRAAHLLVYNSLTSIGYTSYQIFLLVSHFF